MRTTLLEKESFRDLNPELEILTIVRVGAINSVSRFTTKHMVNRFRAVSFLTSLNHENFNCT